MSERKTSQKSNALALGVAGAIMALMGGVDLLTSEGQALDDTGFFIAGLSLVVGAWAIHVDSRSIQIAATVGVFVGAAISLARLLL